MPIKGVGKRGLPFPQIGTIRKGGEKGENKPGKDLEYFRVVFHPLEEKAIADFAAAYPEEPRDLNILFPFNEIERLWEYWFEAYTAGSQYAQADGEKYIYLRDGISGEILVKDGIEIKTGKPRKFVRDEPATHYLNMEGNKTPLICKPVGRLKVMISELNRAAYLTVHTNSWNDIETLTAQLYGLYDLSGENIQGLPIVLKRRPRMVSTPGKDGKRVRREKWLLQLEADPYWTEARFKELKRIAFPELPAGDEGKMGMVEGMKAIKEIIKDNGVVIDAEVKEIVDPAKPEQEGERIRWTSKQLANMVKNGVGQDVEHAEEILKLADLPDTAPDGTLVWWGRHYLGHTDTGKTSEQAAELTNKAYKKYLKDRKGKK